MLEQFLWNSLFKTSGKRYLKNLSHHRRNAIKGSDQVRVNLDIRAPKVRVIDEKGQVGIMHPAEAVKIAQQRGLDLIEIVPNANPPVCKIMDFGKFKYEQTKKDKLQRKHQHTTQLKELRFHPNTDVHDFEFKTRHARKFLEEGHKLKATVVFKGREITYKEHGEEILKRLAEQLADISKVDQVAKLEGRSMAMIFAPDKGSKKKPEVKTGAKSDVTAGAKSEGKTEAKSEAKTESKTGTKSKPAEIK